MTNDPDRSGQKDIASRYSDPFSALRAEMDSLFDSFIGGLPALTVVVADKNTPYLDTGE